MSKFVVVNGDTANFQPACGLATFVPPPPPGTITGSAKLESGAAVCVEGDESSVVVNGVAYTAGAFTVPGAGTLTIQKLGSDQVAKKLTVGGKGAIVVGSTFDAKFTVV